MAMGHGVRGDVCQRHENAPLHEEDPYRHERERKVFEHGQVRRDTTETAYGLAGQTTSDEEVGNHQ